MMIELVFCALIIAWFCNCVYINGFDNYYSCMDYNYHNYFTDSTTAAGVQQVDQIFISKGNILSNLTLYFNEVPDSNFQSQLRIKTAAFYVPGQLLYQIMIQNHGIRFPWNTTE